MVRFFLLTAMLAVPVSATTGAPVAATEISGDWSGRIGLPERGGYKYDGYPEAGRGGDCRHRGSG